MEQVKSGELTQLLVELRKGNRDVDEKLIPLVYNELRKLAACYLRAERPGHTLQPTALVHEAYIRLRKLQKLNLNNRSHFFALAARLMRRILVDHARARKAKKREGLANPSSLNHARRVFSPYFSDLLALDQALTRLSERDLRQAQIVELRFFAGLNEEDTAATLGISTRTVKRDWTIAKAWLYQEIVK